MAFPAIPILLGITGLGALIFGRKGEPKAMTTAEYKKELPPQPPGFDPLPNYQPIPQTDPTRPSLIRIGRGQDMAMRIMSTVPYDGIGNPQKYLDRELAKIDDLLKRLFISQDAVQLSTILPGSTPAPPDVLGPQIELRAGGVAGVDVYWLSNARDLHIPAPQETGAFVAKLIFDPKGLSS